MTFLKAAASLFYWHNETINMWTHYLGAACIVWYIFSRWGSSLVVDGQLNTEVVFFVTFNLLGNALPIFLSAFCHQFYCVDKHWHRLCWFLDFLGILTGMFSAGVTFAYLSFYCNRLLAYTVMYGMVMAYILAIQTCWRRFSLRTSAAALLPVDRFPEFSYVLSMFGWVATVIPVLLVVALRPEYRAEAHFRGILLRCVLGPALMGLGITCFAQGHFPERFSAWWGVREGFFDVVGHSHQWWHVLSASLQLLWVALCVEHYRARLGHGCAADH
jgi:adiponectin receptor